MGTYLADELKRKNLEDYIPIMEALIQKRTNGVKIVKCFECFYSQFGHCPTGGSHNAACLAIAKSYMDMPKKELIEVTEKEYKEALIKAAKLYHVRMGYINNIFADQKEEEENEEIH